MGTYIDGLHYTDDEYTIGPDGKATPKRRKVLGLPAAPAAPEIPAIVAVDPPTLAGAPAGDRETTSEPTYQTKVITPAAPAAPAIETKGADRDSGASANKSGGSNSQGSSSSQTPGDSPRR